MWTKLLQRNRDRKRHDRVPGTRRRAAGLLAGLCAGALASAPALADVVVSGVMGGATQESRAIAPLESVAENQSVQTGDDANLTLVVDENALVEMCGHCRASFAHSGRQRIVQVDAGSVRIQAERRSPDERIEIHTPAAVATILGTVVYVTVDEVTGETVISSSESQVQVRANDASPDDFDTIDAMQQIGLDPGDMKKVKKTLNDAEIRELGKCLMDFHAHALEIDRLPLETLSAVKMANADAAAAGAAPAVGAGGGSGAAAAASTSNPSGSQSLSSGTIFTPLESASKSSVFTPPPPPVSQPTCSGGQFPVGTSCQF